MKCGTVMQRWLDAAAAFINELLDGQDYPFWFLMENLWWPGLNMLDARITERLLAQVHYTKKAHARYRSFYEQ